MEGLKIKWRKKLRIQNKKREMEKKTSETGQLLRGSHMYKIRLLESKKKNAKQKTEGRQFSKK